MKMNSDYLGSFFIYQIIDCFTTFFFFAYCFFLISHTDYNSLFQLFAIYFY